MDSSDIKLPPRPELLLSLRELGNDVNAVGKKIADDEELAKEVLSTINAPYFNLVRKIKSTEEAARMLGIDRVINLTTGRLLRGHLFPKDSKLLNDLWALNLRTAVLGVIIGKELNIGASDEIYTMGLFQNAGMALLQNADKSYLNLIRAAYLSEVGKITAAEEDQLGQSHARLGAKMAQEWGLPGHIVNCIHKHHSPDEITAQLEKDNDTSELLLILKLSEYIGRLPGYLAKSHENYEWAHLQDPILDKLELTEGMFKRFEHTIKKKMAEIKG